MTRKFLWIANKQQQANKWIKWVPYNFIECTEIAHNKTQRRNFFENSSYLLTTTQKFIICTENKAKKFISLKKPSFFVDEEILFAHRTKLSTFFAPQKPIIICAARHINTDMSTFRRNTEYNTLILTTSSFVVNPFVDQQTRQLVVVGRWWRDGNHRVCHRGVIVTSCFTDCSKPINKYKLKYWNTIPSRQPHSSPLCMAIKCNYWSELRTTNSLIGRFHNKNTYFVHVVRTE